MSTRNLYFDTVVLGGGAAGLSAAAELSSNGQRVGVLEARNRIGGRILTVQHPRDIAPIELGAEFIHGGSPAVLERIAAAGGLVIDASRSRCIVQNGQLRPADARFEQMKRALQRVQPPRRDVPFAAFLESNARSIPAAVRSLATMQVEGFDAADATRVSTRDVLKEWNGASAADSLTFRPQGGYGALMQYMSAASQARGARVLLDTVVQKIVWRRGAVAITAARYGEPLHIHATRAIVTLPLAVLQLPPQAANAMLFEPALNQKSAALSELGVGPVVRLLLHFRQPFWAEIDKEKYRDVAFFHSPDAPFPTMWTSLPLRTSTLVAWAGGPNAARLHGASDAQLLHLALKSVRSIFGNRIDYESMLEGFDWHDWQADAYARGAYSYVLAKGATARRTLAEPIAGTLFFAGEATDLEESGTVGGALRSSQRAATDLLRVAKRSRAAGRR